MMREGGEMFSEYVQEALKRTHYEMVEDAEPYYGEVTELEGVWATGHSLEECRESLRETIEEWLLIRLQRGLSIPDMGGKRLIPMGTLMTHVWADAHLLAGVGATVAPVRI